MVENKLVFRNSKFFQTISSKYWFLGRIWSTSANLVDFWRNLGYKDFRGRWIEWWCSFFFENRYVESNRSIRLLKIYRFWSTFQNLVDFWRNLGYMGFPGRWIKWRCSFFFKNRHLRSHPSIRLLRSDRFWWTFWNLVDFWRNFDYGGFRGRWIEWRCSFVSRIDIGVESIDSTTAERSILIDFSKLGRFSTKLRIWGFSRALNQMAMFVFPQNQYLWSSGASRVLGPLQPQWLK